MRSSPQDTHRGSFVQAQEKKKRKKKKEKKKKKQHREKSSEEICKVETRTRIASRQRQMFNLTPSAQKRNPGRHRSEEEEKA